MADKWTDAQTLTCMLPFHRSSNCFAMGRGRGRGDNKHWHAIYCHNNVCIDYNIATDMHFHVIYSNISNFIFHIINYVHIVKYKWDMWLYNVIMWCNYMMRLYDVIIDMIIWYDYMMWLYDGISYDYMMGHINLLI